MKNNKYKAANKNSKEFCLSRLTMSDIKLGEAALKHIENLQSPQKESEFVRFIFAWKAQEK